MIKLPNYTSKDLAILLWTIIPFSLLLNSLIFGTRYFTDSRLAAIATPVTFLILALSFLLYGHAAMEFRQRFPADSQFLKKTMLLILVFLLMSGLLLFGVFTLYNYMGLIGDSGYENNFTWAYLVTGILNIFLIFLIEGIYRYQGWKSDMKETEQLKIAYKQSQLIGLKSQINPHVLFNSLNSLSGLIQEDTERAEQFLDQMSKVYRYMLRNEEDQLVTVDTELQFIHSYFSLLKARYNEAIDLHIDINPADRIKKLPPLSLQVIIETALFQNKVSRESPLRFTIVSHEGDRLAVKNNIQPKIMTEFVDYEAGLDNLVKKYLLMNRPPIEICDGPNERSIILPLILQEEEVPI